jgi:hypothetical protein
MIYMICGYCSVHTAHVRIHVALQRDAVACSVTLLTVILVHCIAIHTLKHTYMYTYVY